MDEINHNWDQQKTHYMLSLPGYGINGMAYSRLVQKQMPLRKVRTAFMGNESKIVEVKSYWSGRNKYKVKY